MNINTYITSAITLGLLAAVGCGSADGSGTDKNPDQHDSDDAAAQPASDDSDGSQPATDYGTKGPHAVGYQQFEWTDEDGSTRLVKSWYPATPTLDDDAIDYEIEFKFPGWEVEQPTLIHGHALPDAPLAEQVDGFPLIVFSHGFGMNPEWYSVLTEHFASHGFVVLAPEHRESDWFETVVRSSFERPRDVSKTLDLAESLTATDTEFEDRIDLSRVAVVGHSYGGYTALAAAGARIDLTSFLKECGELDEMDPKMFLCGPFMGDPSLVAQAAGLDEAPEGLWPTQHDPRVKVIVPIAGDAFLFGKAGLAHVNVPTMAIGGTADLASPWDWGAQLTYDHVDANRAALVGFVGADHMIAVNTCSDLPWTAGLPEEFEAMLCNDPAWDRQQALQLVGHFATAFLLDTLDADPVAGATLNVVNVEQFDGIDYASSR